MVLFILLILNQVRLNPFDFKSDETQFKMTVCQNIFFQISVTVSRAASQGAPSGTRKGAIFWVYLPFNCSCRFFLSLNYKMHRGRGRRRPTLPCSGFVPCTQNMMMPI